MAHGITLAMRWIKLPPTRWVHRHPAPIAVRRDGVIVAYRKSPGMTSHVNPAKDRTLPGKARRRARKAAR
jgi:hypothetical protein